MTFEEIEGSEAETEISEGGESQSQESDEDQGGEPAKQAAPKQEQPDTTPFHEHPRFKELVEQKNQALATTKELQQQLAKLQQQWEESNRAKQQQQPNPEQTELQSLINDLKKVDPRLAAQIEASHKASSTIEALQRELNELKQGRQQDMQQREVQAAVAKINQWHESNKVSAEMKQFINDRLDLRFMQGKLNSQNLEQSYKEIYESFKKYEDAIKRAERESYVKDKTKDAAIPTSQPKGTPAKPAPKKPTFSKDPEVAKQQIVSRYLKAKQAEKEASSV